MSVPPVRVASEGDPRTVDETARALARLGGTATPTRRAIVEALLEAGRLRSPETLLREARIRAPGTSLATVYRTLDRLDAAGALKRATLASGEIGYAYCPSGHHEHAICLRCGQVRPIRPCMISEEPSLEGFTVTSHLLDFFGVCAECEAGGEVDAGSGPPEGGSRTTASPWRTGDREYDTRDPLADRRPPLERRQGEAFAAAASSTNAGRSTGPAGQGW